MIRPQDVAPEGAARDRLSEQRLRRSAEIVAMGSSLTFFARPATRRGSFGLDPAPDQKDVKLAVVDQDGLPTGSCSTGWKATVHRWRAYCKPSSSKSRR